MNISLTPTQAMRYSRQIMLPGFDLDKQEQLMASRVLMIGAGGLGCAAAQYLVSSGIGEITIVDDDIVESSNIQRQILHGEEDVGSLKCDSAKASLLQLNSSTTINTIAHRLEGEALIDSLNNHDIALDCTDNLASRNRLNGACLHTLTPLVSGAAIRMEGQLFCVIPKQSTACYECLSGYFGEQNLSCIEAGVMSPLVGVIGAMQALEAIKIVTEYSKPLSNALLLFDGATAQWQQFNVPRKPGCVCAK